MAMEEQAQVKSIQNQKQQNNPITSNIIHKKRFDGTPYAVKVACTVWTGGKTRDSIKSLPISIIDSILWK